MDDGAILELDGDRLIVELHQKSTYAMRVSVRPEHFRRRTYTGKVPQSTGKPCLEGGYIPYELHFDSRIRFPGGGERD